jgi:hypothetical protein
MRTPRRAEPANVPAESRSQCPLRRNRDRDAVARDHSAIAAHIAQHLGAETKPIQSGKRCNARPCGGPWLPSADHVSRDIGEAVASSWRARFRWRARLPSYGSAGSVIANLGATESSVGTASVAAPLLTLLWLRVSNQLLTGGGRSELADAALSRAHGMMFGPGRGGTPQIVEAQGAENRL